MDRKLDPVPISITNPACVCLDSNHSLCCERPAIIIRIMTLRQDSDHFVGSAVATGDRRADSCEFYAGFNRVLFAALEKNTMIIAL